MQTLVRHLVKSKNVPLKATASFGGPSLPHRTFSTTFRYTRELRPIQARVNILGPSVSGIGLSAQRNYWWSSKPAVKSEAEKTQDLSNGSSQQDAASSLNEKATLDQSTSSSAFDTSAVTPSTAEQALTSSPHPVQSIQDAQASITETVAAAMPDMPDISPLAMNDYSHLFSWVFPPGVFLRVMSLVQDWIITSPILAIIITAILFRVVISPFQFRAMKANARFAPYKDEWTKLQTDFKQANAEGDKLKAYEAMERMKVIQKEGSIKPFAPLIPAVAMLYTGIGGFIGIGRLTKYQQEVVELGGTGPLANPGGVFGTGWLENLSLFDLPLLGVATAIGWVSMRRAAYDSPTLTEWSTRIPAVMPIFSFVLSWIAGFSAAQLIAATATIGFNIIQSYAIRVPSIRTRLGLDGVQFQKDLKFPGPWTAVKEGWASYKKGQMEKFELNRIEHLRRERERLHFQGIKTPAAKPDNQPPPPPPTPSVPSKSPVYSPPPPSPPVGSQFSRSSDMFERPERSEIIVQGQPSRMELSQLAKIPHNWKNQPKERTASNSPTSKGSRKAPKSS